MPLLDLIVVLVVVGVVLWAVNQFVPMAPPFKTLINVLVVVFVCLWLLRAVGFVGPRVGP